MLVLSRHRDESIMIGDDVVITIVDIRGEEYCHSMRKSAYRHDFFGTLICRKGVSR